MKIRNVRAIELTGATPAGGWSAELEPEDSVHTLVVVETDEGISGVGSVFTNAGLVRALVDTAATEWRDFEPDPTPAALIRAGAWRASRYGVRDQLVDPVDRSLAPASDVVWALFEQVGPALDRAGDTELVREGLERILGDGTGADRQRSAARAADGDLGAVVAAAAEVTNRLSASQQVRTPPAGPVRERPTRSA